MAGIQTGKILSATAKKLAAKSIASALGEERGKEGKLSGLMSILSPLATMGSKELLKFGLKAAGLTFAPWLTPLMAGITAWQTKKTLENVLRKQKGVGADPSKITADGKYGYGVEEAEEYKKLMEEGIEDRGATPSSLLADIGMSYASAITPTIGVTDKIDSETGEVIKGIDVKGGDLTLKKIKEHGLSPVEFDKTKGIGKALLPSMEETMLSPLSKEFAKDPVAALADITEAQEFAADYTESFATDIPSTMPTVTPSGIPSQFTSMGDVLPHSAYDFPLPERPESSLDTSSILQGFQLPQSGAEELQQDLQLQKRFGFQQGGQVPSQSPTISDYFGGQGMTIGGSNIQSLSQILGRK